MGQAQSKTLEASNTVGVLQPECSKMHRFAYKFFKILFCFQSFTPTPTQPLAVCVAHRLSYP